ncbi:Pc22g16240 [Penicillium rubens Wisconsin 54-1255]|uniref:Pc22g16240 protein n=1 Tax=Penicillium rubens (strain ATCC 28089 / DSM 1075 / NRRL 1951 / Wisconsin 54-1255) TaxID=500485 RepID=B6HQR9_PENRW|nr:Pc22g16240 [Penicillium rubens Wisconsin 54-1255]
MDRSLDEIIAEDTVRLQQARKPLERTINSVNCSGTLVAPQAVMVLVVTTTPAVATSAMASESYCDVDDTDRSLVLVTGCTTNLTTTDVRVDNLHYDITETDLEDLFGRIGPVSELTVSYDRAGRSEGVAFVTYARLKDAHTSIQEYDGANAKGQPIRLSLVGGRRDRNPLDSAQRPRSSLLDRIQRPRDDRSMSPEDNADGRRRRGGGRPHRSDVTKPAPDNIDRYVPGQRSHQRSPNRRGGGRRGRDNRSQQTDGSNRRSNARPRKTQEELDQEMEDYWGGANNGGEATAPAQDVPQQTAPAPSAPAADDDIDMIE